MPKTEALLRQKVKVALATSWKRNCGIANYAEHLVKHLHNGCDYEMVALPTDWTSGALQQIVDSINAIHSDMVHIQHAPGLFGGEGKGVYIFRDLVKSINKHFVVTLHEFGRGQRLYEPVDDLSSGIKRFKDANFNLWYSKILDNIFIETLKKAQKVIVHSECQKELLIQAGLDAQCIEVIVHGIPVINSTEAKVLQIKEELGLQGKFIVSTFGFIKRFKHYEAMIKALRNLPENIVYVIAGAPQDSYDQTYYQSLTEMIKQSGLESRIRVTGYLDHDQLESYHRAADVMVFPYIQSAASGAMSYAFAFGKAIVASQLPMMTDINNREEATIALFENEEELSQRILKLYEDPSQKQALEARSNHYAQTYSYEYMAQETLKIYKGLN